MIEIDITLYCDGNAQNGKGGCPSAEKDFDYDDLDMSGDISRLPKGWESDEDGQHFCPLCVDPRQREGVCGEPRPSEHLTGRIECYCRLEPGHSGEHECHRSCMTWGVAA